MSCVTKTGVFCNRFARRTFSICSSWRTRGSTAEKVRPSTRSAGSAARRVTPMRFAVSPPESCAGLRTGGEPGVRTEALSDFVGGLAGGRRDGYLSFLSSLPTLVPPVSGPFFPCSCSCERDCQPRRAAARPPTGKFSNASVGTPGRPTDYPAQLSGGRTARNGRWHAHWPPNPPILLMTNLFRPSTPLSATTLQIEMSEVAKAHMPENHVGHARLDEASILDEQVAVFKGGFAASQYDEPTRLL